MMVSFASEKAMKVVLEYAEEFVGTELPLIKKAQQDRRRYEEKRKFGEEEEGKTFGGVDIYVSPGNVSFDLYVFVPEETKPEIVYFTYSRLENEGTSVFGLNDESHVKTYLSVEEIPAFKRLDENLISLGL